MSDLFQLYKHVQYSVDAKIYHIYTYVVKDTIEKIIMISAGIASYTFVAIISVLMSQV